MRPRLLLLAIAAFAIGACNSTPPPPAASSPTPTAASTPDRKTLVWVDRTGARVGTLDLTGRIQLARVSPDGTQLAWIDLDGRLWVRSAAGGEAVALSGGGTRGVAWSPDSTRIASDSPQPRSRMYLLRPADRIETALAPTGINLQVSDWSKDGRFLSYQQEGGPKRTDVWLVFLKDEGTPAPQVSTSGVDKDGMFSPDSMTMAYVSEREGRDDVFIRPFPNPGEIATRVSERGGTSPRWSRDGRELFYVAPDDVLMAASITPAPSLAVTGWRALFPMHGATLQQASADGQRLLLLAPAP